MGPKAANIRKTAKANLLNAAGVICFQMSIVLLLRFIGVPRNLAKGPQDLFIMTFARLDLSEINSAT